MTKGTKFVTIKIEANKTQFIEGIENEIHSLCLKVVELEENYEYNSGIFSFNKFYKAPIRIENIIIDKITVSKSSYGKYYLDLIIYDDKINKLTFSIDKDSCFGINIFQLPKLFDFINEYITIGYKINKLNLDNFSLINRFFWKMDDNIIYKLVDKLKFSAEFGETKIPGKDRRHWTNVLITNLPTNLYVKKKILDFFNIKNTDVEKISVRGSENQKDYFEDKLKHYLLKEFDYKKYIINEWFLLKEAEKK